MRGPFLGDPSGGLGVSLLIGVGASCAKASRNLCGLGGFGVRLSIGGGGLLGARTGMGPLNVFWVVRRPPVDLFRFDYSGVTAGVLNKFKKLGFPKPSIVLNTEILSLFRSSFTVTLSIF